MEITIFPISQINYAAGTNGLYYVNAAYAEQVINEINDGVGFAELYDNSSINIDSYIANCFEMLISILLAVALAVGLFMLLPMFLVSLLRPVIQNGFLISLLEGILRVIIFLAYIFSISQMKDIRRVFMYHGAEHKCINCIEHGLPLDTEHVRESSRQHKRCGTSFLLFVMVVSIFVGIFLPKDILWQRLLSRLIMLPVVMGISYELIQWAGRTDSKLADIMSKPGLWLQNLTTREPEDEMIEVGMASVNAVFDWKAWQENELGIVYEAEKEAAHDL